MGMNEYARIQVALGDSFSRVIARSSFSFDKRRIDKMRDDSSYVVEEPVVLEYSDEALGFELPPTRFVWMTTAAGRVWEVSTSPHLEALSLEQAHRLAVNLHTLLQRTRWHVEWEQLPPLDELAREFDETPRPHYSLKVSVWRSGEATLTLSIKRLQPAESPGEEAEYTVDLRAADESLFERLREQLKSRRRLQGSENTPLPLKVWMREEK